MTTKTITPLRDPHGFSPDQLTDLLGSGLIARILDLQRERWPTRTPSGIDHSGLLHASNLSNGQT